MSDKIKTYLYCINFAKEAQKLGGFLSNFHLIILCGEVCNYLFEYLLGPKIIERKSKLDMEKKNPALKSWK